MSAERCQIVQFVSDAEDSEATLEFRNDGRIWVVDGESEERQIVYSFSLRSKSACYELIHFLDTVVNHEV